MLTHGGSVAAVSGWANISDAVKHHLLNVAPCGRFGRSWLDVDTTVDAARLEARAT